MTSLEAPRVTDYAAMMRLIQVALRDREWEGCAIGREVSHFMRAFRWRSESEHSHRAYESVLGLFALRHADWSSLDEFCSELGIAYIREFLDAEWGGASRATKARQVGILHSFFRWAVDERRIPWDPSATIRAPRVSRQAKRLAYDLPTLHRLVSSQGSDRDQCALELLCRMGLRRDELRRVTIGEIDLVRGYIFVHGKGGKDELLPLPKGMQESLYLHIQGETRQPKEYLLYARDRRFQPMSNAGVHNWFKRCLRAAGLPETMMIHEMRHSAADALHRSRGDVSLAQQLLRHSSLATTEAYLHPTKRDLAEALQELELTWGASV